MRSSLLALFAFILSACAMPSADEAEDQGEVAVSAQALHAACPDMVYARLAPIGWDSQQNAAVLSSHKYGQACYYAVPLLSVSKPLPNNMECNPPPFETTWPYVTCIKRVGGIITSRVRINCPNPVYPGRPQWYQENFGDPVKPVSYDMHFPLGAREFPPESPVRVSIGNGYRAVCHYNTRGSWLVYYRHEVPPVI